MQSLNHLTILYINIAVLQYIQHAGAGIHRLDYLSMSRIACFGFEPTEVFATFPSLKTISVGMDITPLLCLQARQQFRQQ
jgi:hypothetical protein